MKERILVVDDDPDILQFVRMNLELEGFEADTADGGLVALETAKARPPDLVLLDVMMPEMDGLTVLRRLRNSPATANVPVIILTAKALAEDRVKGLDLGADDYITKPFDLEELVARVRTVLRRAQQMRDLSPLTGLPGNFRISRELEKRVERDGDFSVVHADLDNFKAFNDHYGFMRGDSVIKFAATTLLDAAAECGDEEAFVGHVGGDDFVAVISPDHVEQFCKETVRTYDDGILEFYDTADALQGFIEVTDRRGERHAFPVSSISLGVATNQRREINSEWEASAIASEMKEYAKRQHGSSYQIDRRT
ncbi:MAG: response regulator [Acidimicrobiia bacterium]|nr:response regulator [Acidimicrobiia bacterium]NNC76035.1 response regulator [Acidimicrobiia bacterium]